MNRGARVDEVREVTDALVDALARLMAQLDGSVPAPPAAYLDQVVRSDAVRLLVAHGADGIIGTLTVTIVAVPTGVHAHIEDVVVDEHARGRGVGEALAREAIRLAREAGARTVDLTSRPDRRAAHGLYRKLGFEQRDTVVYRHTLVS